MVSVRGQIVLLLSDALFTYAIEFLKKYLHFPVAYEFSLKFSEFFPFRRILVYLAAFLTLATAAIADNCVGKVYPVLIGIVFAFGSGICCALHAFVDEGKETKDQIAFIGLVLMVVYISMSAIRNVLILEQMELFNDLNKIRRFIFCLVYSKIVIRVICRVVFLLKVYKLIITVNTAIAVIIIISYFALFIYLGTIFYNESFYFNIWWECILCFVRSFQTSVKSPEESGPKKVKHVEFEDTVKKMHKPHQGDFIIPEPRTTKACYGFRGIFKNKNEPITERIKSISKPPSTPKKPNNWFWEKDQEEREKSPGEKGPEVKESLVNLYNTQMEHWLHGSRPKSSEYEIHQAVRFYETFTIILAATLFSMTDHFITVLTSIQADISQRSTLRGIDAIDPPDISLILDFILFPVVFFCLLPLLRKVIKRDVVYFFFGYTSLFFASVLMMGVHGAGIVNKDYLPGAKSAQIRIYNGLEINLLISASWLKSPLNIPANEIRVIHDIHMRYFKETKDFNINNRESSISYSDSVNITEGKTTSIVAKLIKGTSNLTLYTFPNTISSFGLRDDSFVVYNVMSSIKTDYDRLTLIFSNINSKGGKYVEQKLGENGKTLTIEPGTYNVVLRYGISGAYGYSIPKPVVLDKTEVYSFFIFYGPNQKSFKCTVHTLEKTPGFPYVALYFQLFFASLGRAFGTVSFFTFLYVEAPEKLRSTLMSTLVFYNLIWFVIFDPPFLRDHLHGKHITFMILFVFCQGFVYLLSLFGSNRFRQRMMRTST